ncbi:hypothetical protein PR048_033362 [Dryococelus australis]|uniref:Uncharacterized protein n=1 Tax=Dryococelus australis TaxID=614101 RepID=A0ABQ9G022_9NEOP|nr:hypothetical protein PR048_033362 [Dryococelus australis]
MLKCADWIYVKLRYNPALNFATDFPACFARSGDAAFDARASVALNVRSLLCHGVRREGVYVTWSPASAVLAKATLPKCPFVLIPPIREATPQAKCPFLGIRFWLDTCAWNSANNLASGTLSHGTTYANVDKSEKTLGMEKGYRMGHPKTNHGSRMITGTLAHRDLGSELFMLCHSGPPVAIFPSQFSYFLLKFPVFSPQKSTEPPTCKNEPQKGNFRAMGSIWKARFSRAEQWRPYWFYRQRECQIDAQGPGFRVRPNDQSYCPPCWMSVTLILTPRGRGTGTNQPPCYDVTQPPCRTQVTLTIDLNPEKYDLAASIAENNRNSADVVESSFTCVEPRNSCPAHHGQHISGWCSVNSSSAVRNSGGGRRTRTSTESAASSTPLEDCALRTPDTASSLVVGRALVGTPRPRSRSEGAIRATLTRAPSASSPLRSADGNNARLARKGDEALQERVSVARIEEHEHSGSAELRNIQRRNEAAVHLIWASQFADWLCDSLEAGLICSLLRIMYVLAKRRTEECYTIMRAVGSGRINFGPISEECSGLLTSLSQRDSGRVEHSRWSGRTLYECDRSPGRGVDDDRRRAAKEATRGNGSLRLRVSSSEGCGWQTGLDARSNWTPVHNVCSVVVTPLESRRATSCGYNSGHPVWHALYECLQDIHGDSSPYLL